MSYMAYIAKKERQYMRKKYIELPQVENFFTEKSQDIADEYGEIVEMLETQGRLSMPFGEKISGKNLFAIRVIQAGNVRVFYVYGIEDRIYGLYAYHKKTQKIPLSEMKKAEKTVKILRKAGQVK